jgi:hypothetical protein
MNKYPMIKMVENNAFIITIGQKEVQHLICLLFFVFIITIPFYQNHRAVPVHK